MLYTARKYISGRCYNGTIMSTLLVTQYCHVHFHGGGVVVLEVHVVHLESFYTRLKRILRICTIVLLYYYDQNPFRIFLSCIFFTLVIPARSKVLICTRKRNPEDSGRSSRMVSSCQWPFSSFLLASALLKSSFYFNHSGTLQSSAVVSYDIINIDKKMNLFALRQKIGKFRN